MKPVEGGLTDELRNLLEYKCLIATFLLRLSRVLLSRTPFEPNLNIPAQPRPFHQPHNLLDFSYSGISVRFQLQPEMNFQSFRIAFSMPELSYGLIKTLEIFLVVVLAFVRNIYFQALKAVRDRGVLGDGQGAI